MHKMIPPTVSKPTFEHHNTGFGVGHAAPRISWKFRSSEETIPNWVQTAYEIEISNAKDSSRQPEVYNVEVTDSVLVPWPAKPLRSREAVQVRVRSVGRSDDTPEEHVQATEWSEPAVVETGLLEKQDWKAQFVAVVEQQETEGIIRPVRFWKAFNVPQHFDQARLYISSFGVFEVLVNGQLASDECMAPGWTSYKHRLTYRTLDVGPLLKSGTSNTICIHVAEGWYAGRLGFAGGSRLWYGKELGALAQLEINSGETLITTDDTWLSSQSAVLTSSIYDGEVFDHRQESEDLAVLPSETAQVKTLPFPTSRIMATDSPPVRVTERLQPISIFKSKSGKTLIDFGQNLVGKIQIKSCQLENGAELVIKHAEVLEHEELGTRPLRKARNTDVILGSGKELLNWCPKFTFHGFRYVQIEGWPLNEITKEDVTALVMHSDLQRRGHFKCSNKSVNQLHENVTWSMRGNFVSIPTDCPQRDERLGWTGDLQVFGPTAAFLYDTVGFLGSWLEDVADEQMEPERNGIPPLVVPDVMPPMWPRAPQAIWQDVTILTPWDLFQSNGDIGILEKQFDSMKLWLDQGIERGSDGLWNNDRWQLGDWLDPVAPPDSPGDSRTDDVLVADAYLVHITETMHKLCQVLGKDDLAAKYGADFTDLKTKFQSKYITPNGNLMSNTQTGIALAVCFNLYNNADQLEVASNSLKKRVRSAKFNIATGFAGTPVVTHALTKLGQSQLAYRMLLEKSCPSWLYPITMGATTIWERWNSMLPDGTINPGEMTSFNHYALGAVANWLHTTVGGISPLEPGYKTFIVRPIPGGNVTSAEVKLDGPYGEIFCSWKWHQNADGRFEMKLVVPPNSKATVILPSLWKSSPSDFPLDQARIIGSGIHQFSDVFHAESWPPKAIVPFGPLEDDTDKIAL